MGTQTDFLALPPHILKRDGMKTPFDATRIESALRRAGQASGEFGADEVALLTAQVIKVLAHRFGEGRVPDVESIQDVVEQTLISANYLSTARAYIIYREQRHKLRVDHRTLVDVSSSIDEYLDRSDWRVAANANQGYSLGGLILNTSGKMIANYWLNHVYPPEIGEAHREGDFHIHDLDMLAGYCFTGDTRVALLDGTTPTLRELALTKAHESFWVYSRDSEGNVVPGKAHSPRLTRKNVDVVAVIISGGHTIKCTPDHEFMLRDGTYKKASALRQDDSLSPLYVSQIGSGYLRLSDAKLKLREYVHRIIASSYYGDLTGKSVHHINGNKTDNRPENLRVMDDADHRRMELCATISGQVWRAAQTARLNEYNRSDSKRETISQFAKTRERDSGGRFYNHTVRCAPQLIGQEDVYCLTVEDYENFALAAGVFVHNCAGWSLRTLLNEGLNGVPGKVEADPPKHMSSAVGQIVNFLGTLQNEWAGAQAFSSFDTYMAPFVRVDGLNYTQVKQAIQELIYNLNVPSRWGCQTPFTNLTFDWVCPEDLRNQVPVIAGVEQPFTYGELQAEMDLINRAYIEVMTEGDAKGRIFTFPIPTYNITSDFPWEGKNTDLLFGMTAKYGLPYFCLEENTLLFTRQGIKAIKEVTLNDEVIGSDGHYKPVKNVIKTAHSTNITLTTENGCAIICSENHRFPTAAGLKQAADLSLNDTLVADDCTLAFENGLVLDRKTEFYFNVIDEHEQPVALKNLTGCPTFCRLQPKVREFRHPEPFVFNKTRFQTTLKKDIRIPSDINEDLCEVLGQLMGDGSLKRGKISLANADAEILDFFQEVMLKEFNLTATVSKCGISECCKTSTVVSIVLTDYFEHLGISLTNCYHKRVPDILYYRTDKEIGAFLRGLFDTDGSVSNQRNTSVISLTSVSTQLISQVIELLALLSIAGRFQKKSQTITITGARNVRLFSEKVGFRLSRKKAQIRITDAVKPSCGCKIIEQAAALDGTYFAHYRYKKAAFFRVTESFDNELWLFCETFTKNCIAKQITKIERRIEPTTMIDLEIDSEDHLFLLANGVLTHNSNFVSSDMDPHMVRSMCCRLRLDVSELLKRGNGLFGSAEQTGSLGVVTINCARLGFTHRGDERGLLARLDTLMELARNSLEIKRKLIQRHMDSGLFPYTKRYLGTLRNHFSTIGVNGVNEMIRNFTQDAEDITTVRGHQLACRLLDHVRSRMIEFQELTGSMYNLEATPAEGTTYRFAREDQKRFPDIIQAGTQESPYYTNSSQLPVGYTDDPFEALEMQETLQSKYTGGTVLHLYMSEQLSSADACKRLVRRALENFRLPYVTVTPVFSICPKHGYIAGEHHFCPLCDQELIARKQAEHNRAAPRLDLAVPIGTAKTGSSTSQGDRS